MTPTTFATAGSQRWLQVAVTLAPELLHAAIADSGAIKPGERVEWTAPLISQGFAEPRDGEALRKAGIASLPHRSLLDFWPRRGPVWDAVAQVGTASLFVEAKANVREAASPPSKASLASLAQIQAALQEARRFYAPDSAADWHGVFYQYANRLAHHYFLTQVNRLDSRLVFLYFLNAEDVRGPSSITEWEAVTKLIHAALGLPQELGHLGIHHAYLNVQALPNAA
jgi:hypothetical protein